MPKILQNPRERILEAAKVKLEEGPESFSMRSIAKMADVSVGTIYKYYPDKIYLVATIIYGQWESVYKECLAKCHEVSNFESLAHLIIGLIKDFGERQQSNFDAYQTDNFTSLYKKFHPKFVSMIKELWLVGKERLCISCSVEEDELIVEIFILARKSKINEETFINAIQKIIKKGDDK